MTWSDQHSPDKPLNLPVVVTDWLQDSSNWPLVGLILTALTLMVTVLVGLFGQGVVPLLAKKARARLTARARRMDSTTYSLPAQSLFLGREQLVQELTSKRTDPYRLILEGPRGAGKSALALAVARTIEPNYERSAWVDLKHETISSDKLLELLGRRLGVVPPEQLTRADRAAMLSEALSREGQKTLVVVDNFESVPTVERPVALQLMNSLPGNISVVITTSVSLPFAHAMQLRHIGELLFVEASEIIDGELNADPKLDPIPRSDEFYRTLYTRTGGNVLALRWAIGRLRTGLDWRTLTDDTFDTEEILNELFVEAWTSLSQIAKRHLHLLSNMGMDPSVELLLAIYGGPSYIEPTEELLRNKLIERVDDSRSPERARYMVHPLARDFTLRRSHQSLDALLDGLPGRLLAYISKFGENGSSEDLYMFDGDLPFILTYIQDCLAASAWTDATKLTVAIEESLLTLGLLTVRRDLCLRVAQTATETPDAPWRSRLRVVGAQAAGLLNDFAFSDRILRSVHREAADAGQSMRAYRAFIANRLRAGHVDSADEAIQQLEADKRDTTDNYLKVDILYLLANIHYYMRRNAPSMESCDEMDSIVAENGVYERAQAYSGEQRALVLLEEGRHWSAVRRANEARAVAVKHNDVRQLGRLDLVEAKARLAHGQIALARKCARSATMTFERLGLINEWKESTATLEQCNLHGFWAIRQNRMRTQPRFMFNELPIGGD